MANAQVELWLSSTFVIQSATRLKHHVIETTKKALGTVHRPSYKLHARISAMVTDDETVEFNV